MRSSFRRAASAALVLAVVLGWTAATAGAEQGRVITVQSSEELQKRADTLLKGIGEGGGKVKYGSVEPGEKKDGVVIKDVEITGPDDKKVTIERIEVREFDWANPKEPLYVDLSIKKLVIPPDALDKEMGELGLTTLTINADFDYALDAEKKTFEIEGIVLDVAELGELKLSLKLAGVVLADLKSAMGGDKTEKPGEAKPGPNGAMKALAQISIVGASITFKDKSLVERMIRADAKKKKISEAEAKAKLLADLAEQKKQAQDDTTREVIDLATKFVTKPGVFELMANPAAPANVMAAFGALMGSPAAVKQMLGLTLAVK